MKSVALAVSMMLYGSLAFAQQYIIRYDLAGEHIDYLKVKKPGDTAAASVISIAKSNRVNLQLVNAANSYRREISYIEKAVSAESIVIPGFGATPLKNLVSGGLPSVDFKSLGMGDIFKRGGDIKSMEIGEETAAQKKIKEQFTNQYNSFTAAYARWENSLQQEQYCKTLWKELAGLRYSLQLSADEVKTNARKKTNAVFPEVGDNPSLIIANNATSSPAAMAMHVAKAFADLQKTYASFRDYEVQSSAADKLLQDVSKKSELVNNYPASKAGGQSDDVVNRIADLYGQILTDNYSQVAPLNINSKTLMAEIRFVPVIDSATASIANIPVRDTIKRLIPVLKKEPIRFRNTFGFSFVSFAENRWNYFVKPDSTIAREEADQFQPVVVTYLHFYAPKDKGFRWGGSFGAGVPIGGDNSKLNIMLGLSTFLGKNDPVCITIGASGAQVKKLSGINLGDKTTFTELTDKNYRSVYRIGYFLSLTFNPGSLYTNN
ncbi:MAG TPA: hypothetical protein PKA77_03500 [Chitinophagaceae bacterium]|jgi:hypothetical protein|nr:hypothetical protein [Chitinophagaceae bacterium]HMU58799.1 hypothetical protein [Chitinophagaceae bacterium]